MRPSAYLAFVCLAAAFLGVPSAVAAPVGPVQKNDHPQHAPAAAPAAPVAKKPADQQTSAAQPPVPADRPHPLALLAAIPPGAPGEKIRRLLLKPYATATGTDLPAPAWDGSSNGLKTLLGAHGADLVLVDAANLADLCRTQAITKLDWNTLDRARSLPGATSDCGAGAYQTATTLAWDRSKFPATPSWADFWDVARHPGRRGLQNHARGNLEIALLADGVGAGDVYRTLRTADGVDRAFRKLDQLKPYLVWWDQPAQAADLISSGKALLTSAPIDVIVAATGSHPNLGFSAAGNLTSWWSWTVPQAAPHAAAATLALIIAADPARQADFARATGYGPATTMALDLMPADVRALSPSLASNQSQSLNIDEGFWAENHDKLEARFSAWLSK